MSRPVTARAALAGLPALLSLLLLSCSPRPASHTTRIAFGSGNSQSNAQPLWPHVTLLNPAAWIWAGNAVHPASPDTEALRDAFARQKARPDYLTLTRRCRILGIPNLLDAAPLTAAPEARQTARDLYLDFLAEPALSPRRSRPALFAHYDIGAPPRAVRILLLDPRATSAQPGPQADLLGPEQWRWLETALATSKAPFNLLVSPIPVLPPAIHGEKWADYPASRSRLLRLLASSGASGVVILSGGRLVGELSRLQDKLLPYPLHELTSGGFSHTDYRYAHDPNRLRIGETHVGLSFGLAEITWSPAPRLTLSLVSASGEKPLSLTLDAAALRDPGYRSHLRGAPPAAFD